MKTIIQFRTYKHDYTVSTLHLPNGETFKVLEDVGRPVGVKIAGETCIPEGVYHTEVTFSNRFGKPLPIIGNRRRKGQLIVNKHGIEFTGIRVHGGNTTEDTDGCPLVAVEHHDNMIWNCAPAVMAVTEYIKNNKCLWVITSESEVI
jgi:hypothetical protein